MHDAAENRTAHRAVDDPSRKKRRKAIALAVLSGGAVIGLGLSVTLASWSDSEWVFAGDGLGGPGLATQRFEVQQNTSSPFSDVTANWADRETNPGGSLTFSTGALSLSPGVPVYAPVSIRTTADSIAGAVSLENAVAATGVTITDDGALWNAVAVRVAASQTNTTCAASSFSAPANVLATGSLNTAAISPASALTLNAASGNVWHFCFEISIPTTGLVGDGSNLQAKSIAPAWKFASVSS